MRKGSKSLKQWLNGCIILAPCADSRRRLGAAERQRIRKRTPLRLAPWAISHKGWDYYYP